MPLFKYADIIFDIHSQDIRYQNGCTDRFFIENIKDYKLFITACQILNEQLRKGRVN